MSVLDMLTNCAVVSTVSQEENEKEWLAVRNLGVGGSDVGPICGVSNFSTARTIYLRKTGQYEEPYEEGSASSERMHFGHLLEPIVASEFERRTGKKVVESPATVCHKDHPWARANVDRFIVDDEGKPYGILECKTTDARNFQDWEDGDIPMTYIYQLNWYLWICDLKYGAFACLIGGNRFITIEVWRNDDLLNDTIIPKATKFWNYNVKKLIEPELGGTDADADLMKELYSDVKKDSEIMLEGNAFDELAERRVDLKARLKEMEVELKEVENKLKDALKSHEIGYTTNRIVKWSPRVQERVDTDVLKRKYPEVYADCKKTIRFRVMTVK